MHRGAFATSLARRPAANVRMLDAHDARRIVGVWDRIEEDGTGLRVEGRVLAASPHAADLIALIAADMLDGLSIGYKTKRFELTGEDDVPFTRKLLAVDLWEVSIVAFPSLPEARIDAFEITGS